jgi:hypothetical protein
MLDTLAYEVSLDAKTNQGVSVGILEAYYHQLTVNGVRLLHG